MTAPVARLSDAQLPPRESITDMWPGRHVEVSGARLFVRKTESTSPDAEPALLVHGLAGSATNWTDLAGLLRTRLDIEAIDLPGFGRSGPPPGNDYRLRTHARAVVDYLEQSGRAPLHLVGNSMGGAVCIEVAASRPDLVRTLTLISPAVPDTNRFRAHALRGDPRMALLVVPGLGGLAMRRVAGLPPAKRVKATIRLVFADPARYPRRRLHEAISELEAREASAEWANAAFLRSLRELARSQFMVSRGAWRALGQITAPTLVIWGDRDRLVAPSLAPAVAAAVKDARLLVMNDIGHTAQMEDPETTARAILALIEDTR